MKKTNKSMLRNIIIVLAISCVAMLGASPLFADVTYEDSLVAYWDFDEGSDTVAGDATGVNNGTLVNGSVWTTGPYGGALSFDGVDDCVRVTDSDDLSFNIVRSYAVSAWVYKTNTGYGTVIDKGVNTPYREYRIGISDTFLAILTGKYTGDWGNVWYPALSVPLNTWAHITVTWDGNLVNLYYNGLFNQSTTYIGTPKNGNADLYIGSRSDGSANFFNGLIDDVAIWNRALDVDEIASIYDVGVQGFEGILNGITTTFGDLGYTTDQIKQLTDLYAAGDPGNSLDFDDDITWSYLDGELPGDTGGAVYNIGDSWEVDGTYYIKLGSGLAGAPLGGAVPELPVGAMPFLGVILRIGLKRLRQFFK